MTSAEQLELISALDQKTFEVMQSKGADYADADILSNFKQVSEVVKALKIDTTTPEGYAMLMVVLKIARISNLKEKGTTPQNESLIDSYEDLINYTKLAYLCEMEEYADNTD